MCKAEDLCALCGEDRGVVNCWNMGDGCRRWFCLACWGPLLENKMCFECQDQKDERQRGQFPKAGE